MPASQSKVVESPVIQRRRLKVALRHHREAAGLTQKAVSEALDWSVSKIIRIEAGAVGLSETDLGALMDLYEVTDQERQAELVELAHGSRKQPWSEYSDVYSVAARTLFHNEAAAKIIYKYEPTYIPGLLQTEEYARALLAGLGHSEHEVERMVRARLERQQLLEQDRRPQLEFILDEAAVSRAVGSRGVLLNQLERLKYHASRPGISLRVLQFEAGAHPRMGGSFTILEFADETLDDLLYLENAGGESVSREDPELVAAYRHDFVTLQELASPSGDFAAIIDRIVAMRLAVSPNTGVVQGQ